jgi:FtsZ-binding cell division protein ZapB
MNEHIGSIDGPTHLGVVQRLLDANDRIAELEAEIERLKNYIEECRSVSTHWHANTIRLEAGNERLRPDAERYRQIIRLLETDCEDVVYLAEHVAPEGWDDRIDSLIEFDAAREGE